MTIELRLDDRPGAGKRRKPKKERKPRRRAGRDVPRPRGLVASVIIGSIAVHVVALVLFGIWVVARNFREPAATFTVTKVVKVPVQTPEHRMNMAAHEAMTPKPVFDRRLASSRPAEISLPELPEVDLDQMLPLDPSELIADQVTAMAAAAGLGLGQGRGLSGGDGSGSGFSFFDIEDSAESVVIMIDVSNSMFGRTGDYDYDTGKLLRKGKEQSFQRVRDEAVKLVSSLGLNARFNVIRWSGSARPWRDDGLVRATDSNKAAAIEHIQNDIDVNTAGPRGGRPGGTRHDYALEAVFELQPEVAFMLTDGNATRSLGRGSMETIEPGDLYDIIEDARESYPAVPRIHTIYYLTGNDRREEARMLRGIASRTKGEFRKIKVEKN